MLPLGTIFFPLIVAPLKCVFLNEETDSTDQKLVYRYRYHHIKDVSPFIAYCVTEFKTVFHGLIFWQVLFIP